MDGAETIRSRKSSSEAADFERVNKLRERLEGLLREAAEVEVELSRADGTIKGIPHYSLIEGRAHELGKQLSREVQQRQMNELAASQASTAKCPDCGTWCPLGLDDLEGTLPRLHADLGLHSPAELSVLGGQGCASVV